MIVLHFHQVIMQATRSKGSGGDKREMGRKSGIAQEFMAYNKCKDSCSCIKKGLHVCRTTITLRYPVKWHVSIKQTELLAAVVNLWQLERVSKERVMTKGVRAVPKRPRVRLAEVGHITGQQRQALSWPEIKQRTTMSKSTFFLVSLPTSISQSNDRDEALTALRSVVSTDNGTTYPFSIPSFKIGTLDALVQQADDLQKLEQGCKGVVEKVADSLKNILEGDEDKIADQKNVNDKPVDHYLQSFQWNKVKYRAEKPISELVDMLQKVGTLFLH